MLETDFEFAVAVVASLWAHGIVFAYGAVARHLVLHWTVQSGVQVISVLFQVIIHHDVDHVSVLGTWLANHTFVSGVLSELQIELLGVFVGSLGGQEHLAGVGGYLHCAH